MLEAFIPGAIVPLFLLYRVEVIIMKKVALFLLLGFGLGGCFTPTPSEQAYSTCLASVPKDIKQAAGGEIERSQAMTHTALTKDSPVTTSDAIETEALCSPACEAAREEQHRIVSECYDQWKNVHPSLVPDPDVESGNLQ